MKSISYAQFTLCSYLVYYFVRENYSNFMCTCEIILYITSEDIFISIFSLHIYTHFVIITIEIY